MLPVAVSPTADPSFVLTNPSSSPRAATSSVVNSTGLSVLTKGILYKSDAFNYSGIMFTWGWEREDSCSWSWTLTGLFCSSSSSVIMRSGGFLSISASKARRMGWIRLRETPFFMSLDVSSMGFSILAPYMLY